MAKRTIQSARQALEDLAPALNPEMYRRYESELAQASTQATSLATKFADEQVNAVLGERQDVLTGTCELRDAFKALAEEVAQGRIGSRDANERLTKLRHQLRTVERQGAEVDRAGALVERIEADPEGWADETFFNKYPHMQPDFSF